MKTLKLLILLGIVACFSVGSANAQAERYVYSTTWHEESILLDCIGEPITGDMVYNYSVAWMENKPSFLKLQERFKGTYIGDWSGATYTISQIVNNHTINVGGAGNWYWLTTMVINKDGIPVSKWHYLTRGTCNDATWDKKEGNWAVWIERGWSECY